MILLLATLALADAPAPDPALAAGEDLAAWQSLSTLAEPPDALRDALQEFLDRYSASSLAEPAWERLRDLGTAEPAWLRSHRALIADLERSLDAHAQVLARSATEVPVAPLDPNGDPPDLPVPWALAAHLGGGLEQVHPNAYVGARLTRGPWSLLLGGVLGPLPSAELTLRIEAGPLAPVWLEAGACTRGRGVARVGALVPLTGRLGLDAGLGGSFGAAGVDASARVAVSLRLAGSGDRRRR